MKRREFLVDSCKFCLNLSAVGIVMSQLSGCGPGLPVFKTSLNKDVVNVPLSSFAESNLLILRDLQMPYDVLLVKKTEQEYTALYMKCSHQENQVTATSSGLYCSSHGSSFDLDGRVLKEPALTPLKKFKTTITPTQLSIDLKS